jgi:hypothetical protein
MKDKRNLFIAFVIAAGATVLESAIYHWTPPELPRYLVFFLLALVASTRKIRLPGVTTTISPSFLFVLIGIVDFSLSQTVALGCAATLVQCVWKSRRRPTFVQVVFNVASWSISIGLAYWVSHFLSRLAGAPSSLILLLSLGASVFLVSHLGLLAVVLSLSEEGELGEVWQKCFSAFSPLYLTGTFISALACITNRTIGWQTSLLLLPAMYLVYLSYRLRVENAALGRA